MNKLTPQERRAQYFALDFFLFGCSTVAALQYTVGLYFTPHYYIAHFMLGLFLPFFFYAMGGLRLTFWLGLLATSIFHFGYELWEDQLTRSQYNPDWDQILAGGIGILAAWGVYRAWNTKLCCGNYP